jgi:hypothetical protein
VFREEDERKKYSEYESSTDEIIIQLAIFLNGVYRLTQHKAPEALDMRQTTIA